METRSSLRIPVDLEVVNEVDRKFKQHFNLSIGDVFRASAYDLSAGGMGIFSKYFLPAGLRIHVVFAGHVLKVEEFIKLDAEIRYSRYNKHSSYKCGVKFIDPPQLYIDKFNELKDAYKKTQEI